MKTEIHSPTPQCLDHITALLGDGNLIAFPTDTVYGIGALAFNPQAIEKLYTVKARDRGKAIPILVGDIVALSQVTASMSPMAQRLAERVWPVALTLLVPRHPALPENISPTPTIGVRMPDYPLTLEILNSTGPLAVTSANISGSSNACTALEVLEQLQGRVPVILDGGRTPGGSPSTVVDCSGDTIQILRPGPISFEQLQAALC